MQSAVPQAEVEIFIRGRDLKSLDVMSKSDPMAILYYKDPEAGMVEIGRTEAHKDDSNPDFSRSIRATYYFEQMQSFKVAFYDIDDEKKNLSKQDKLGSAVFTMGELMGGGSEGSQLTLPLLHKKKTMGSVIVLGDPRSQVNADVLLKVSCRKLDKKDLFGKSDPYFIIYKDIAGSWARVIKSDTIMNTLNPNFQPMTIDLSHLCGGDMDKQLKIEVYDWDKRSDDDLIGHFTTTTREIVDSKKEFTILNPNKKNRSAGTFVFDRFELIRIPGFVDFLTAGLDLDIVFGIDFTGSNGLPSDPASLHFISPMGPNQYQQAILSIGNILMPYNRDRMFPTFGFGAKLGNDVSHMFPLNMNPANPQCAGVEGILSAYINAFNIPGFSLWGPTNFTPIISACKEMAERSESSGVMKYVVLVMLTDGVISDMKKTIAEVIRASRVPMSLIIIGIGNEDFSKMDVLDSDDGLLKSGNDVAERDIVQFVELSKYRGNFQMLAAETLKELPRQVEGYYKKKGIKPRGF